MIIGREWVYLCIFIFGIFIIGDSRGEFVVIILFFQIDDNIFIVKGVNFISSIIKEVNVISDIFKEVNIISGFIKKVYFISFIIKEFNVISVIIDEVGVVIIGDGYNYIEYELDLEVLKLVEEGLGFIGRIGSFFYFIFVDF